MLLAHLQPKPQVAGTRKAIIIFKRFNPYSKPQYEFNKLTLALLIIRRIPGNVLLVTVHNRELGGYSVEAHAVRIHVSFVHSQDGDVVNMCGTSPLPLQGLHRHTLRTPFIARLYIAGPPWISSRSASPSTPTQW